MTSPAPKTIATAPSAAAPLDTPVRSFLDFPPNADDEAFTAANMRAMSPDSPGQSAAPGESDWSLAPPVGTGPRHRAGASIDAVASGQKFIIYSILTYLAAIVIAGVLGDAAVIFIPILTIGAAIVGIVGLLRVASGLGFSSTSQVLLILATFVPLLGFLVLFIVNARATRALKDAGYKVGLLGAQPITGQR